MVGPKPVTRTPIYDQLFWHVIVFRRERTS